MNLRNMIDLLDILEVVGEVYPQYSPRELKILLIRELFRGGEPQLLGGYRVLYPVTLDQVAQPSLLSDFIQSVGITEDFEVFSQPFSEFISTSQTAL
jgi:hypothetical protein